MRCDYLIRAMGCIDGTLVDEAEDYKPARKNHAWIWAAASAACVLMIAAVILRLSRISIDHVDASLSYKVCLAGYAEHGYVDYRAAAEQGKVVITDELKALLDENKEPTVKMENGHKATVLFSVHIYDAGGTSAEYVFITCLAPLEIRYEEHEGFFESGIISLTREQILNVKCPSELSLVIEPQLVEINEEYLDTIGTDTLKVRVVLSACNESETFMSDFGINGVSMEYGGEHGLSFIGEFDVELIAQMIVDPRTIIVCIDNNEKYK